MSHPSLLHEWFEEVWNNGRVEAIDELMAPNAIAHGIVDDHGNDLRGPAAFKTFFHKFRESFPDIRITILDHLKDGDKEVVRCSVDATHQGHQLGFAPSGKPVTFTGMCIARVENKQIVEAWNNFDFLTMYQQLGLQLQAI